MAECETTAELKIIKNSVLLGSASLLCVFLLVWATLVCFTPATFYWRDAAEFIISSFALDIAHPAGYPLYSQLSNLFALLPIGTIAFRVNLFSSFCAALLIVSVCVVTSRIFLRSNSPRTLAVLVPALVLLQSPSFLRQALSAEVYMLYGLLFTVLLLLVLRAESQADVRDLIAGCFLGGLALGNHVALGLSIILVALVMLTKWRVMRAALFPGICFGVFGLALYLYLPIRASSDLPLNTGAPTSAKRTFNLLSDLRDRDLKVKGAASATDFELPLSRLGANLEKDLNSLDDEIGPLLLGLACVGLIVALTTRTRLAIVLALSAVGNWAFFQGWQPDPWIPLFVVIAIFCGCVALPMHRAFARGAASVLLLAVSALFLLRFEKLFNVVETLSASRGAEKMALLNFERYPRENPLIVESSWFSSLYLSYIQGAHQGGPILYQPRLLFPYHFEPIVLSSKEAQYSSWTEQLSRSVEPNREILGRALHALAPISLEPNISLNTFLKGVAQLEASGAVSLVPGKLYSFSNEYSAALIEHYSRIIELFLSFAPIEQADAQPYLETLLINDADLLDSVGKREEAKEFLSKACARIRCSMTLLHNLRFYGSS